MNLNATSGSQSRSNQLIYDKFITTAKEQPNKIALEYKGNVWTYRNVQLISQKIALLLKKNNFKPNDIVGIYADKTPAFVMAVFGVLRAGGSFATFDNSYPQNKLQEQWQVLNPSFLIDCTLNNETEADFTSELVPEDNIIKLPSDIRLKSEVLNFEFEDDLDYRVDQNDTAYYLFTSGTTGVAKCIATDHRPLCHFVNWQTNKFSLTSDDKFTMLSGLGHDPIMRDIFTPLSIGGRLIIPEHNIQFNPGEFYKWLKLVKPSICHITPQMSKLMVAGSRDDGMLDSVRYYFSGGDVLAVDHIADIHKISPLAKIINFYGSTETPQAMGYYEVPTGQSPNPVPIGQGISDVELIIQDKNGEKVAADIVGEIIIRTEYLSQSCKKKDAGNGKFDYMTGDYGFYDEDQNIIFNGRKDDQVKIRGFRVELNDINVHLKSIAGVKDALTLTVNAQKGEKSLVTYLVADGPNKTDICDINQQLIEIIPTHMVPTYYIILDAYPLLPNGKIDRHKLPAPTKDNIAIRKQTYVAPTTQQEVMLVDGLIEIMGLSEISIHDTFTTLAGDSLSFVQTTLFLEDMIGHVPNDWNLMTVKQLAAIKPKKSYLHEMNSTVLVRAIAIVAVVIYHFGNRIVDHSTYSLFIIAGISFANFQMKSIAYADSIKPIYVAMLKIFLPTMIYSYLAMIVLADFRLKNLLFVSNFFNSDDYFGAAFWFVHTLLQILLVMAIIMFSKRIRNYAMTKPYEFGMILLSISLVVVSIGEYLLSNQPSWDHFVVHAMPQMRFWPFALGWCIYYSPNYKQSLLLFFIAVLSIKVFTTTLPPVFIGSVFVLLFVKKIKMVAPFHKIFYRVAAASLFIYLTHGAFRDFYLLFFEEGAHRYLEVIVGVLGGMLVLFMWDKSLLIATKLNIKIIPRI